MIATIWHGANLTLAFLMELVAFTALALWAARYGQGLPTKVLLGVVAAGAAMALWGLFAAPQATFSVPVLAVLTKIAVFGTATLALRELGHPRAALAYPVVVIVNLALINFA
ncbi:YrdB family protein [Nocardia sp. NPDC051030]|uniref:YrdB family protein n=1 Tax=Nocardia sp. NPDC051030 TaxID=3155162 RepID=UPI0034356E75